MNDSKYSRLCKNDPQLTSLDASIFFRTIEGVKMFAAALKSNTNLKHLEGNGLVFNRQLTDEGVQSLCEAIKINTGLNSITLYGVGIKASNIKYLSDALSNNKSINKLDISGNIEIGDKEVALLINSLSGNTTLTSLGLSSTSVGDHGIEVIEKLLKHTALQTIDLSYNPNITLKGLAILEEALRSCDIEIKVDTDTLHKTRRSGDVAVAL